MPRQLSPTQMKYNHFAIVVPLALDTNRSWGEIERLNELLPDISIGYPYPVISKSSAYLRKAVHAMAVCFRREFHYDFVPYTPEEKDDYRLWKDCHFLFTSNNYIPNYYVGAVGFRWRRWKNYKHAYALTWVWFHPYERRKGHLTKAWPNFKKAFAPFNIEGPFSKAMDAFITKMEPDYDKNDSFVLGDTKEV